MTETGWTAKADQKRFLVVFPEGARSDPSRPARFTTNPQTWNDGSSRPIVGEAERKIDDVGFINALIDDMITRFKVDEHRIYATGFSNGASMTFHIGRELSERITAIAPVAGSDWLEQPMLGRPVALLYITGTADPLNPIEGGEITLGSRAAGKKPPVRAFIRKWAEMLGCPLQSDVVHSRNGVSSVAYGPCKEASEVVLYTVEGMGHTWPGGRSLLPERLVGKTSDKINANDVIWEFFQKHTRN
jgi:polyhydroxybutyrate depolymerase